jgi:hypothetical protein
VPVTTTVEQARPCVTEQGDLIWMRSDLVTHRDGGPAVILADGTQKWYRNGYLHREDGPAQTYPSGAWSWWQHGQRHREDGPAVRYRTGRLEWYLDDVLDRPDGPAVVDDLGEQVWFHRGVRHRTDGPAVLRTHGDADSRAEWWVDGVKIVGFALAVRALPQHLHAAALKLCLDLEASSSPAQVVQVFLAADTAPPL